MTCISAPAILVVAAGKYSATIKVWPNSKTRLRLKLPATTITNGLQNDRRLTVFRATHWLHPLRDFHDTILKPVTYSDTCWRGISGIHRYFAAFWPAVRNDSSKSDEVSVVLTWPVLSLSIITDTMKLADLIYWRLMVVFVVLCVVADTSAICWYRYSSACVAGAGSMSVLLLMKRLLIRCGGKRLCSVGMRGSNRSRVRDWLIISLHYQYHCWYYAILICYLVTFLTLQWLIDVISVWNLSIRV